MRKICHCLLLLLWSGTLFAQVTTNPLLSVMYTAPGGNTIQDFKYNKVFIAKDTTYRIIDLQQHTNTLIPLRKPLKSSYTDSYFVPGAPAVWLTSLGAVLTTAIDNNSTEVAVYEWRSGALTLLKARTSNVKVAGNYVIWGTDSLYLRNLYTRQQVLIDKGVIEADVAANGVVAYKKGTAIYKYRNGVKTLVANNGYFNGPATDGEKIIYMKGITYDSLYLYNGTTSAALVNLGGLVTDDNLYEKSHIRINNGYVAYIQICGLGQPQVKCVWIRDRQGNRKMLTSVTGNRYGDPIQMEIKKMDNAGNMMLAGGLRPYGLYYADQQGKQVTQLTNAVSDKVYFENSRWFISHDSVLFKVNTGTIPANNITPFDKNTLSGTPIRFTADDFTQHFSGTGQLEKIEITALPRYGKLTIGGKAIHYERSREILKAELDSLIYTPKPWATGVDTLQWKAFNGIAYTTYDTSVALHVYPVFSWPPLLRTVKPQYNSSGAPEKIKIANYPQPTWHTDVTVQLDSTITLPVAADSTFEIDPGAYAPGLHHIRVTFAHLLDTISISKSFTIVQSSPLLITQEKRVTVTGYPTYLVWNYCFK